MNDMLDVVEYAAASSSNSVSVFGTFDPPSGQRTGLSLMMTLPMAVAVCAAMPPTPAMSPQSQFSDWFDCTSYIRQRQDFTENRVEILMNFASKIVEESEELPPDLLELLDKHIHDLI